ncbi:MAG: hypothetical protein ACTSRG_21645 [Candidatus Helarchaeota archaeon]
MMIYTPTFLTIKKVLTEPIIKYIKEYHVASALSVHQYIQELKDANPEMFKLIEFSFSYPYSDQVADVLTDLIRDFIIDETDEGYILTSFGQKYEI